ncbi:MAG: serine/threonine-protein kinase [Thermoguttaceae bacterium]|jgi:serine/threonine-protein kinase
MNNPSPEENELKILDTYLAQLQAGQRPDRGAMLREHPELASALECLEALEKLGPKPEDTMPDGLPYGKDVSSTVGELPRGFGGYQLLAEIGRGGMGVVYKARQEDLDRVVAVKMILSSHLASPEQVRRFQAEARAAAKLRHSHIVPIHEVGQLNGQDYFTMDYIEGQSLAQYITEKTGTQLVCRDGPKGASHKLAASPFSPIDVPTAVRIVSAIARAVEYLHRQGIVHRDLKPSNILLDTQGEPYLTDFGLAKFFAPDAEHTATGVIAGTPAYMAPEQAAGRGREVGPGADVYSLGAILYELLTGVPPFLEENPLDTLLNVLSVDPMLPRRLNPKIPRQLELICLTCLRKTPGERYASAEALADDLDRFARGEPIKVRPPHLGQRFLGWTRRQPALASRLGGLALFYVIDWINFLRGAIITDYHIKISIVLAVWVIGSVVCQRLVESRRWSMAAPFIWGTLDSILFLIVLLVGYGVASAMIVGYILLIVASGLWFRVRFVTYMAVLSLLSYGVLMVDYYYIWRPWLDAQSDVPNLTFDRHVIFAVSLAIAALIVAYLVERVRILSSFYGQKNKDEG